MAVDEGLADWTAEACAPLGAISRKRLFGGATLYCDGFAFAILAYDALWFKADAVYDDMDAMRDWARLAIAAARRAPVKRRKPR